MEFSAGGLTGKLARLGAVIAIAATLGACSVIPSWMGGDSGSSSATEDTADASAPPTDQTAEPAADSTTASTSNGQFPDLADTPDRPAAPSTADDQKRVADSLAADRTRQNYSADALRAGTETAAPPPGAAPPPDEVADVDTGAKSADASDSDAGAAPASGTSADASSSNSAPATADTSSAPTPAPTTAVASAQTPAPAPTPSGGLPAVPANSSINGAQSVAMSDTALGFQASKAPPLDASVAQFVPMPIMSRYQQTASLGGAAGLSGSPYAGGGAAVPAVPNRAMGGPERMTGAVVANYDALQGGAVAPAVVYSNAQGLPPAAVVMFANATTILSADAKAQVRSAAETFNARGATGYIRVVGHASSATSKVSEERRLQINFERSQARATSVMRELIKDGVPANKILIDAVGDSQPVYDAAAQGENGNRRAEIFFQG